MRLHITLRGLSESVRQIGEPAEVLEVAAGLPRDHGPVRFDPAELYAAADFLTALAAEIEGQPS